MATSPNLEITHIEQSQSQKEVTANEAFNVLDAALSQITITLTSGSPATQTTYALSETTTPQEWQYGILNFTGSPGLNKDILFPLNKKFYIVYNGTNVTLRLTVAGSPTPTGVTVDAGDTTIVRCDGTNIVEVSAGGGGGSTSYDIAFYIPGLLEDSEIVLRHDFSAAVTFPASLTGSYGSCETAASAVADFTIYKNGSSVGTIRFNPGSPTDLAADFIMASQTTFAAGDILKVVGPTNNDDTLAYVSVTLKGERV